MKTIVRRTSATLLLAVMMTMGLMAQPQNKAINCGMNIPDLTEEQKTHMQELRTEQVKSTQTYRNLMGELRARQRTLMSESPIDEKAMGKLIDEKTALTNKHMKEGVAHRAAVNEILTEEQQVYLNQMQHRRQHFARKGAGRGTGFHRNGQDQGLGRGQARGQGRGQGRGW